MRCRLATRMITVAAAVWCLILTAAAQQQGGGDRAAKMREEAGKPTPRSADGHPDLSGNWSDPPNAPLEVVRTADGKTLTVLDRDAPEIDARAQPNFKARAADNSRRPPYKPQFVAKQRELMYTASRIDPGIHCYPKGVPRLGAPTEIVQTPTAVFFFYAGEHTHRIIPIGGRHNPEQDPLPDGDSIAYWEGETLVVDVTGLNGLAWFDRAGNFASDTLHVVERFTRIGPDHMAYEATMEDPAVFTRPWKIGMTLYRSVEKNAQILDFKCVEFAEELLYGQFKKQTK